VLTFGSIEELLREGRFELIYKNRLAVNNQTKKGPEMNK
jgi:hypothetical protein